MIKGTWKDVNIPGWIIFIISGISAVYFLVPFSLGAEFNLENTLIIRENRFYFIFVSLFIPVFTALFSFHKFYINREKNDIKVRKKFFFINLVISVSAILVPYIAVFFLTVFICSDFIAIYLIAEFFIKCIICSIFILAVCVMVAVTVRTIIIQSFYIISILFLPLILESAIFHIVGLMAENFIIPDFFFLRVLRGFPTSIIVNNNFNFSAEDFLFYFIVSILIFQISFDVFTKHIPIKTDGYIRYDKIKGIFRFIFFLFFSLVSIIAAKTSVLILIICSFINLFLCELILNGRLKINKGQKWYFIFIALIISMFFILKFDLYHINEPEIFPDEVLSVYMGTDYKNIKNLLNIAENEAVCDFENINYRKFYKLNADKINRLINFQKTLKEKQNYNFSEVFIGYKLRNGKIVVRKYHFDYRICIKES